MSIDNGIAEALLPIKDWLPTSLTPKIKQILSGERTGYSFKSGMELKVKITEVSPFTESISSDTRWMSFNL